MRCPRCGNDNAETNRFCGMCGGSLISNPPAAETPRKDLRVSSTATQAGRTASVTHGVTPGSRSTSAVVSAVPPPKEPSPPQSNGLKAEPGITGPSFLGLNTPPSNTVTPRENPEDRVLDELKSSRNLDYLLQDDEEEPSRGWGKLFLVLVALGLALGFGYLHWKQGGFDWIIGSVKKPQAASPDTSSNTTANSSTPTTASPAQPSTAAAGDSNQPAPTTTPAPATAATPAPATNVPPSSAVPAAGVQTSPLQTVPSGAPQNSAPSAPSDNTAATSQPAKLAPPEKSEAKASDSEAQPAPEPTPKPKPSKPSAAVPVSVVSEAERYLYGRGVRQDCDHGLRVLKRAAESDPKAMTAMGSLYSTGTCTPRDLPTAYRWYAQALHRDPDNQALQNDLQKLWSQMTQPERQLAIRLSQ